MRVSLQALRSFLAVAMAALFYVSAAVAEVLILRHLIVKAGSGPDIHWKADDFFYLAGALILPWCLWPRREVFTPPGPLLEPAAHPELFRMLEEVAAAAGQPMPADVYLIPEFNAWVRELEGTGGSGNRSIMGVGYPLFLCTPPGSLRAILAHEFGHYHGGDTRHGLRFYKVSRVLHRTVQGLRFAGGWIQLPFYAYLLLFQAVTLAVSRRQELAADRLAASIAGAGHMAVGLRVLHGVGTHSNGFWEGDLKTILDLGFRPPILEGLSRAVANPKLIEDSSRTLVEALAKRRSGWLDSHPPLARRLAEIGVREPPPRGGEGGDSRHLLGPLEGVDEAFLGTRDLAKLKPLPWEEVGEAVEIPALAKLVSRNRRMLRGLAPEDFPGSERELKRMAKRATRGWTAPLGAAGRADTARHVLAGALIFLLRERGWIFEWLPGEPLLCRKDGRRLHPHRILEGLVSAALPKEEWLRTVREIGIAGANLEEVAARAWNRRAPAGAGA